MDQLLLQKKGYSAIMLIIYNLYQKFVKKISDTLAYLWIE